VSDIVTAAIVAGTVSLVAPVVLALITGRQRSHDKHEDWRRQDELASRLDQIHGLVNSTLTAQMEESFQALSREVILMREIVSLNQASGHEPLAETLQAIILIEAKAAELRAKLDDRLKGS
jgi:hypothetical protein